MKTKRYKIEQYFKYLENAQKKEYFPLSLISQKISLLMMFREVINKSPGFLEESYRKCIELNELDDYATLLLDYILLEIRSFYSNAHYIFGKKTPTPKYYGEVKEFRDTIVSHLYDYRNEKTFTDNKEIVDCYRKIYRIGFDKIYADWIKFRNKIDKMMNEKDNKNRA